MLLVFVIAEVVRGNTVTRIPNGIYTSSVSDRGGFSVKCIDTANEAWRVISAADVEVTTEVFPRCNYLSTSSYCKTIMVSFHLSCCNY